MARLIFDLSGSKGLVERYHGDIDAVAAPNLRYLGEEGQFADGVFNPQRKAGFLSASNSAYSEVTVDALPISFVYDADNDDIYFADNLTSIWRLDTPTDTTETEIVDLGTSGSMKDMCLYEVNGKSSLVYAHTYKESATKYTVGATAATRYDTWSTPGEYQSLLFNSIIYGNGFFLGSVITTGETYTSPDGIIWTSIAKPASVTEIYALGYKNGYWFYAGGSGTKRLGVSSSSVMNSWTQVTTGDLQQWFDIAGNTSASIIVAVANYSSSKNIAYTLNKGLSWNTIAVSTIDFLSVDFGSSNFVAGGSAGQLYTSSDGSTWTVRTSGTTSPRSEIAYGNSTFVSIGSSGTNRLSYSTDDGVTWTAVTTLDAYNLSHLTFGDGYFITGDNGGNLFKSTDGINWTSITSAVTGQIYASAYGNGYFIITPGSPSTQKIAISAAETEVVSATANKTSLGFYSIMTAQGLSEVSSNAYKVFPTTYSTQKVSWDETGAFFPGNQGISQRVDVTEINNSKIEVIRLGIISNVSESTVIKVAIHSSATPAGTLLYSTTLTLTATDSPVYKEWYVDFGTQSEITVSVASIAITLNAPGTQTIPGYFEVVTTPIGSYLHEYMYMYNGSAWSILYNTSIDFEVIKTALTNWTSHIISGAFEVDFTETSFIRNADNGLLYWFTDNKVHSINGGVTGGARGIFSKDILVFPDYFNIYDAVDTHGRIYIAIQSNTNISTLASNSNIIGVYIWDRLSSVTNFRDFIAIPGVSSIRTLFVDGTGIINAICIGNDKFVQLRQYTGNEFKLIKTLGQQAYPISQRGVGVINNMTYWYGKDGNVYMYGQTLPGASKELYKLFDGPTITNPGAVLTAANGSLQSDMQLLLGKDHTTDSIIVYKPYDLAANYTSAGSFHTQVKILPTLSTIKNIRMMHIPTAIASADTTEIGQVSCYINMSTTPAWTHSVTQVDLNRGYIEKEFNQNNVNSIQFKGTWSGLVLTEGDYCPMYFEVNTVDEQRTVGK